jgi:polyisoprenoid-binding protein YceI
MKRLLLLSCALVLAACSPRPAAPPASASASARADITGIPAGDYSLDPEHASLTFHINHMGFSHYTARFAKFDAHMRLDPEHPETASLTATVDPQSLQLNAPPAGFHNDLMSKTWFDAKAYPQVTFSSTKVVRTGANTADITGDLTLRGISRPVVLHATYNGGYPGLAVYDPHARIGFSATGTLNRSDFGMDFGILPPNSHLGVSDAVDIDIEAEFTGPAMKDGSGSASAG